MTPLARSAGVDSARRLPVLMYHGVHRDDSAAGVYHPRYSVDPDRFARQLDWLKEQGIGTTLLSGDRSAGDVVLSFDDGDESWLSVVLPRLVERGMVAEFCVTSDFVGRPGMITSDGVRELVAAGMGVQSHGRTHRPLSSLAVEALAEELTTSKQQLQEWSGRPVVALALPGGRGRAREFSAARAAGYRFVLNSVPGPNRRPAEDRYLHRIVVTRDVDPEQFGRLVRWQGRDAWELTLRTWALELPKRVLGDERYGRARRMVRSR